MKALGKSLFAAVAATSGANPHVAYERVFAADLDLPESWFRDAIFHSPELVIGPCREAGLVPADEKWLPWAVELVWNSTGRRLARVVAGSPSNYRNQVVAQPRNAP